VGFDVPGPVKKGKGHATTFSTAAQSMSEFSTPISSASTACTRLQSTS